MKNIYKITVAASIAIVLGASMMAFAASSDPAILAGQQLWSQLQAKQIQCSQLTATNFNNLGDYFMDQMMGSAHQAMEQAVIAQSGQAGLDAMHVAMGERFSGCNPNAAFPASMMGYGGMTGGYGYNNYYNGTSSAPYQNNVPFNNMMGYGYGYGPMMGYGYGNPLGWIFMVLFWALIVVGIIALVRWMGHGHHRGLHDRGNSALDVLKERYAKGEIDKKEFDEKKKDLA